MATVTQIKHDVVAGPAALAASALPLKTFTFDALPLHQGGTFGPVTLAYETWGSLNAAGDNAVLITHALTGNTHAHDAEQPDNTKIAWWNPLIGPGRYFGSRQ